MPLVFQNSPQERGKYEIAEHAKLACGVIQSLLFHGSGERVYSAFGQKQSLEGVPAGDCFGLHKQSVDGWQA